MARTSWSTSTARSCSERLPHPPRSVRLASRRSLCARQCSRVGDFRHFVTAITGGGWVLCEVKALSHGTKGQSNGYHRFGYYRRDRIRRLVGLYGCAVEGWEGGCLCGVGSDLTACDYVALASRRNTGRILTDIAASEPLVIRPPRSARLAASALARRSAVRCTARRLDEIYCFARYRPGSHQKVCFGVRVVAGDGNHAANRTAQTGTYPFGGTPPRRAVKRVGDLEPLSSEAAGESPGVFKALPLDG